MKNERLANKLVEDIWYSPRRYFVDNFFFEKVKNFKKGATIADLGGKKKNKRGEFDIEKYELNVKYVNIDPKTEPDYLCSIENIPAEDNTFDGAILGEVLEHVKTPVEILKEAYRVLKPGAILLITTPFVYNVHADPYDYFRYTDYWYKETLAEIGFKNIEIEKQGQFFGVIANMLKTWMTSLRQKDLPKSRFYKMIFSKFVNFIIKKSFDWDENKKFLESPIFSGYTTGYGVVCTK